MAEGHQNQRYSALQFLPGATAVLCVVIGFAVLVGWWLDIAPLKNVRPNLPDMAPNTALGLALAGVALALLRREPVPRFRLSLARAVAAGVTSIGLVTLTEYLVGVDLGVDRLLVYTPAEIEPAPFIGRPGFPTAWALVLIGSAFWLIDVRPRRGLELAQSLMVLALAIALLALTGFANGVPNFYGRTSFWPHTGMALHTAILITLLGAGAIAARPDRGLMAILRTDGSGGTVARRLILLPVALPLLLGLLYQVARRTGVYTTMMDWPQLGGWLFSLSNIFVFMALIWWNASVVCRADTERKRAEHDLRRLNVQLEESNRHLEDRVAQRTAELHGNTEELWTSRAMLQGILNHIPLGVVWKDRGSRYLGCNAVVSQAMGFSDPAEIVGRTDAELSSITPEQAEYFVRKDREVMDADLPQYNIMEQMTRADGTTIWLETNKIPMHDDQGSVTGLLGTWEDVTERKQAEQAIVNYNERLGILHQIDRALIAGDEPAAVAAAALPLLRNLLGTRRVVVSLFDLAANEVEWLAAAGPRRVHVGPGIRYSLEFMGDVEALRKGEMQFMDVAALPRGPEVAALLASGIHSYVVVPMIARGELIGALSFGGTPVRFSTEQISIAEEAATQFAIAITQARLHESVKRQALELEMRVLERTRELKEAHASLQETNAELEAANKELEAFSYSVSHDLRAPLRAINGFSRIVLEDYASQLPEDARTYLEEVRTNTLQMGRLVDDLLEFSRLSRQPVHQREVDTAQLVRQCLDELRRVQDGRNLEIRIGDLPSCQADPALLKQVWINLLANALKYTGKREATVVDVGCRIDSGRSIFFVKDNGVGFDMRYAYKLFGVFQRLHRAEDYEGTGVGLAIVQRIIHRHGGQVWAEAEIDHGATFMFTLGPRQVRNHEPP